MGNSYSHSTKEKMLSGATWLSWHSESGFAKLNHILPPLTLNISWLYNLQVYYEHLKIQVAISLSVSCTLFLVHFPFCLFLLSYSDALVFVLSYYVFFNQYPLAICFLLREDKRDAPDGRRCRNEAGGVEEEETIIRIYYLRKIAAIFNKRKNPIK